MTKEEREKDIKGFNQDLSKLLQHDIKKNIHEVYEDTKYSNV